MLRPLAFFFFFLISLDMFLPVFQLSGCSFPPLFLGGVSVWRRLFVSSQSKGEKRVAYPRRCQVGCDGDSARG